ncbi:MAG: TonB-dependent receptor [Chitinophagaceae bacterium]
MKSLLLLLCGFSSLLVMGQNRDYLSLNPGDTTPSGIFTLGEVIVTSAANKPSSTTISAGRIQQFGKTDVARALNMLPGITLSAVGPRNEAMIYLRGFDLRQVPLLIDGIPVYIPYDGYVDLARFTTFDISEINVSKGYTSVLYGPNALGGAINLITRKPAKRFELNGASGWLSGGYRTNINVGSNLGKWYFQAGVSRLDRDSTPLSRKFSIKRTEEGGWRNNSYNRDEKFNVKVGYTPGDRSEYAVSYLYQHGEKGTPPYAGSDSLNSQLRNPRFWQWPKWNKQSLYFISNTAIDSFQYIKTRFYYDRFTNLLNSYDDASYTLISRPYAFRSHYNDYTFGGIVEYGVPVLKNRDFIRFTAQFKQDIHKEFNEGEPERQFGDRTITAGFENELKITSDLLLLTGFSYNNRHSTRAQDYNSSTRVIADFPRNTNDAFNVQGGLQYILGGLHSINISVARKTRFPTTKDRYSYRLGTAIPNTALKPESAVNYEFAYRGNFTGNLLVQAALFYSRISNTIFSVSNVKFDSVRNVWQSQLQNTGKAEHIGGEASVDYPILPFLKAGVNYTYIKRNNLSNPSLHFIDVPEHKIFGFLQYQYNSRLFIQANTEYNSTRYSTSYGTTATSFTLLNSSATVHLWRYFSVEVGVNNIFDRNYALVEGYVEPGRNYYSNIVYRF